MGVSQLQYLIENSALSDTDKDVWLRTLEVLDDEQAVAIMEAIGNDPHELETITRNLKLKQVAIAGGDHDLLQQILDSEQEGGGGSHAARGTAYQAISVVAQLVATRTKRAS